MRRPATGGILPTGAGCRDWDRTGFPIAECRADGSRDHQAQGTGGPSPATVGEQIVYEVRDPAAYVLPTSSVTGRMRLEQTGEDRVRSRRRGRR